MNRKSIISTFAAFALAATAQAQIGYQVSLLNTATGEPRANVTVNAQVTITDSQDNTIYTGSQQATTNDFGVLSLAVGDASTFANADTGKMPFFISVSVNGTLIGRSQILNVPVAEVANKLKSSFTKEDLVGTWVHKGNEWTYHLVFKEDGTMEYFSIDELISPGHIVHYGSSPYEIEGNTIYTYRNGETEAMRWFNGKLYYNDEYTKQ